MAEKSAKKTTKKSVKKKTTATKKNAVFTVEERAAMRETARERKLAGNKAAEERAALEAIAAMPKPDRVIAERVHAIVKESAPDLSAKTWYGMPAYAKDGKVLCFFQAADKFKARYATFGFSDTANLDQGTMWPTGFAVKELTSADEAKIAKLVKKAVS
jgi:uncharacterized protein YdhG (YjbR/CyaY superfamily)